MLTPQRLPALAPISFQGIDKDFKLLGTHGGKTLSLEHYWRFVKQLMTPAIESSKALVYACTGGLHGKKRKR
jgi:hypothetical protein